ncbi:hypothetical protein [Streptomyces sp. NBC_01565]|uniref:hypothetical protein n=1 Tax=Streptomyces sp. NBC_01565 TaxID=2975881 RepID=UPI0022585931|nr:hypothetical protein [Streptomyces sp. NBC_01565]MCX4540478.1 hypothetical protein [Streptomyces sp. NBC_01565]
MASDRYAVHLTSAHWESLTTAAHLTAWVEARQLGLSVVESDRIANAAVAGVRSLIETWAQQEAERAL